MNREEFQKLTERKMVSEDHLAPAHLRGPVYDVATYSNSELLEMTAEQLQELRSADALTSGQLFKIQMMKLTPEPDPAELGLSNVVPRDVDAWRKSVQQGTPQEAV
jgi:hypothetical protein